MADSKTIASLFIEAPKQWSLRGDPHLWNEMRDHFADTPFPATADKLTTLLESAFETLTQHSITTEENIYIERLNHGGMSGGHLSPKFWRNTVIPFLREKFLKLT